MAWLDNLIITVVVVLGLFIMYKALKEPIDLVLGMLGKGIVAIKDWVFGIDVSGTSTEVITYG